MLRDSGRTCLWIKHLMDVYLNYVVDSNITIERDSDDVIFRFVSLRKLLLSTTVEYTGCSKSTVGNLRVWNNLTANVNMFIHTIKEGDELALTRKRLQA